MAVRLDNFRLSATVPPPALRRRLRHPRRTDPQHRTIVVIDVAAFGRRTDLAQLHVRADLDGLVREACRGSGIPRSRLVVADRGDGMIVFIPADVSKAVLLQPFVPRLRSCLHERNGTARVDQRIRVRVAVHAGEVVPGPHGWIGTDLNLACRLVDSIPLRQELVDNPRADLVLAVSDVIHQAVVRHGHRGIDASAYREVPLNTKEVATRAWIHTPVRETRHAVTALVPA